MAKQGKKGHGCLSVLVGVLVFLIVINLAGGGKDEKQTENQAQATKSSVSVKTEAPKATATPKATTDPYSLPALDFIKACTEKRVEDLTYQLVSVTREDEFYAIDFNIGTNYGSSRSFVSSLCVLTLNIAKDVFVRDDIDQIRVSCFADLRDKYGNLNSVRSFNLFLKRDTFMKINYEYMKQKVITDPDALFSIADGHSVLSLFNDY